MKVYLNQIFSTAEIEGYLNWLRLTKGRHEYSLNLYKGMPYYRSVIGRVPVAETFGFSNDIRAASQGRATWNTENAGFEPVPPSLFHKTVGEIRERKGLKPDVPTETYYSD